ncbi:hypothetical protein SAMN05216219_0693 [Mycetocola miduiensis]|uniref:Uncharacterized protein n=1 Tax=Mycetocola miduiensis TaxID=995034 RepID=A0A1I4Z383_9MICO|nr:hypothetical protein SAMN05216219_0693 [Mycetocola miduiensis]
MLGSMARAGEITSRGRNFTRAMQKDPRGAVATAEITGSYTRGNEVEKWHYVAVDSTQRERWTHDAA